MRRKDLTTSEARTWCDEHRCKAPPGMLNQNEHKPSAHVANAAPEQDSDEHEDWSVQQTTHSTT